MRVTLLGVVVVLACAACSSPGGAPLPISPPVPTFDTSAATSSATRPPGTVPTSCAEVAEPIEVDATLGHHLGGGTGRVLGVPQPSIGRLGRLDCYYGVPKGKPVGAAAITIGVAAYTDQPTARRRATATVDAGRAAGGVTSQVQVGEQLGVLVATGQDRTLVVTSGQTAVVVTARAGVLPQAQAGVLLAQLALRALGG